MDTRQSEFEPFITTFSGTRFYFLDPTPEMVNIEDIAHALARIPRFGGHLAPAHYSVAHHSLSVAFMQGPPRDAMCGLLHDAAEAYWGDMPAPMKRRLPEYAALVRKTERVIEEKFDVEMTPEVKLADSQILTAEARNLFPIGHDMSWLEGRPSGAHAPIMPLTWGPEQTEQIFLDYYFTLRHRLDLSDHDSYGTTVPMTEEVT